ncbi:DUF397 domain-containing protein [Nocardiopsis mangrovi]|uniref:DUF397 domain-containing protein n=1 Tax=Nocardiopsis mangrovi TaxID=1179818 RepID=A0ABV9DRJ9_9ACTN
MWWKSSYSNNPPDCVEVARVPGARVLVRDSHDPGGAVIGVSLRAWREFVVGVGRGELG